MQVTIANNNLKATINLKGAELVSLQKTATKVEYIWNGNSKFWSKHSPILFPIVGTLKNNEYNYKNISYQLFRHGFARDLNFIIVEKTNNSVVFLLQNNTLTKENYPFDFELFIDYKIIENTLLTSFKINNLNAVKMPFSIGAHPAFSLPNNFENYSLLFDKQENLEVSKLDNDLISDEKYNINLVDKKLPLAYSIFKNDALVLKKTQSKLITILDNSKPLLKINFEDFKNLGLWTKIDAPFICIEPWLGYTDTKNSNGNIEQKEAIILLNPNNSFTAKYTITIC